MKHAMLIILFGGAASLLPPSPCDAQVPDVQRLRQAKDIPGLGLLLQHPDGQVRSAAAVALSAAIVEVEDPKKLAPQVLPLVHVTLRDPYATVREYAGRAMKHSLRYVSDPWILQGVLPALLDCLHPSEVELGRRRYCAVTLSTLIAGIQEQSMLAQSVPPLLRATLEDADAEVREYAGRALRNVLSRAEDPQVLQAAALALAGALRHQDAGRRLYAAVAIWGLAPRLTETNTLAQVATGVREAAASDSDPRIREYAARAARLVEKQIQAQADKSKANPPRNRNGL